MSCLAILKQNSSGHRFHEVTHPEDIDADWSQCLRLIRGDIKSFDLEKRYIRKDGGIVWAYINCSVVTDTQDKPVHFLTYIRDITNRKLNEEKLREYQESLRQLANELNTTEERERRRFAADLHDHIGQSLVLAKFELGRLGELPKPSTKTCARASSGWTTPSTKRFTKLDR